MQVFLLTFLCSLTTLSATPYFTTPTQGTVWITGQPVDIVWQGKNNDPATLAQTPLAIDLVFGNASAVQTLGQLVVACSERDGRVRIQVPETLPTSSLYALRAGGAYTPQFTIQSSKNVTETTTFQPIGVQAPLGGACEHKEGKTSTSVSDAMMHRFSWGGVIVGRLAALVVV